MTDPVQTDNSDRDRVCVVDYETLKAWAAKLLADPDPVLGSEPTGFDFREPDWWAGVYDVATKIIELCDSPAGFTMPEPEADVA
jgi:hypothetical protein